MQNVFLKTERLILRYITQNDFEELKIILQDKDVMYSWEYDFSIQDIQNWIDKNIEFYRKYNLGYFLMIENYCIKMYKKFDLRIGYNEKCFVNSNNFVCSNYVHCMYK